MMALSPNFALDEMLRSQTALRLGLANTPSDAQVDNLKRLCMTLLEPVRSLLGCPLHVDSGYRSPIVNAAVGGSVDSAHMDGRAADVIPIGVSLQDAFDAIQRNTALPWDQLIGECGPAWLHLAVAKDGSVPRRQVLTCSGIPGHWTYSLA